MRKPRRGSAPPPSATVPNSNFAWLYEPTPAPIAPAPATAANPAAAPPPLPAQGTASAQGTAPMSLFPAAAPQQPLLQMPPPQMPPPTVAPVTGQLGGPMAGPMLPPPPAPPMAAAYPPPIAGPMIPPPGLPPNGWGPPPAAPHSSHRVAIVIASVVALLVVLVGAAVIVVVRQAKPVSLPNHVGQFSVLNTPGTKAQVKESVQVLHATGAKHVAIQIYTADGLTEAASALVADIPTSVQGQNSPTDVVNGFVSSFTAGISAAAPTSADPGPNGGYMVCGLRPGTLGGLSYCVWSDGSTVSDVSDTNGTVAQAHTLALEIRAANHH
jgi:hypothetical protein